MKVIKLAVIGAGWIGTMHARAMNNVRMCYGSDVVPELELIVDAFEDAAKKACDTYSFNRYSTNTDDAINDPAIDAVMITTPNQFHVELVQKAAAAGKAIFCEKPLGMDGKDAKKALDAVAWPLGKDMSSFSPFVRKLSTFPTTGPASSVKGRGRRTAHESRERPFVE